MVRIGLGLKSLSSCNKILSSEFSLSRVQLLLDCLLDFIDLLVCLLAQLVGWLVYLLYFTIFILQFFQLCNKPMRGMRLLSKWHILRPCFLKAYFYLWYIRQVVSYNSLIKPRWHQAVQDFSFHRPEMLSSSFWRWRYRFLSTRF